MIFDPLFFVSRYLSILLGFGFGHCFKPLYIFQISWIFFVCIPSNSMLFFRNDLTSSRHCEHWLLSPLLSSQISPLYANCQRSSVFSCLMTLLPRVNDPPPPLHSSSFLPSSFIHFVPLPLCFCLPTTLATM